MIGKVDERKIPRG